MRARGTRKSPLVGERRDRRPEQAKCDWIWLNMTECDWIWLNMTECDWIKKPKSTSDGFWAICNHYYFLYCHYLHSLLILFAVIMIVLVVIITISGNLEWYYKSFGVILYKIFIVISVDLRRSWPVNAIRGWNEWYCGWQHCHSVAVYADHIQGNFRFCLCVHLSIYHCMNWPIYLPLYELTYLFTIVWTNLSI